MAASSRPRTAGRSCSIIPGSGPTDRDGNNPLGISAASYRLLAVGLAESGIGSVRIDKRGMFASTGAVADPNAVTIGDYVADVGSWVGTIREKTGTRCVWLAGHSEGGLVALAAAAKVTGLCGLVLIATPGRPHGRRRARAAPGQSGQRARCCPMRSARSTGWKRASMSTWPASIQPCSSSSHRKCRTT